MYIGALKARGVDVSEFKEVFANMPVQQTKDTVMLDGREASTMEAIQSKQAP